MSKRLISVLVALIMVIGLMPAVGATGADISSQFSDMPNNWATEALEFAVANHLLQGADGKIMPDKPLTRAEMATIIVRAFGASEEGDISSYTDVRKSDWFFEYIAKAFKMGVMEGYSGKMNPDSNITREQAFTVLARALKLQPATRISKTFSDIEEISDWARGSIYALVNAGYIQGSNGKLNPKADITRAEFAQVMFNLIKQYISEEGEYTEVAEGNVMINVPGATLKGLTVSGDLIIGDGVGDGDVVLDDVVVTGRLVIRGGGENSIIIRGNSNVSYIVAARVDGTVRILVEDDAEVEVIYVDDGSDDIIVEGNVGQIEIVADNVTVLVTGASIGSANITGVNSRIIVDADSEVESISVRAANASIDVEGSVNEISTSGANTNVTGGGKVDKVNVEQGGNGASITTPNTEISVGENVTGVTAGGGEEVEGGQTVKNNKDGTGIVSEPPASGGTYVPPVIPVSAISVEGDAVVGATLTAKVTPSGATVNYQWQIADPDNGATWNDIADATSKTYILSENEVGKLIRVKVTGTGNYTGTKISEAVGPVTAGEEPEPVASTYQFSYTVPDEVIAGKEYKVPITIEPESVGDFGYDRVRFNVEVTTPDGATLQLLATDTNGDVHDVAQIGYWGPENGFPIDANYSATTEFTAIFSTPGTYTITFSLVDLDAGEALVTETVEIVAEPEPVASTYQFSYTVPDEVIAGKEYKVPITIEPESVGDFGYDRVRFNVYELSGDEVTQADLPDKVVVEFTYRYAAVYFG